MPNQNNRARSLTLHAFGYALGITALGLLSACGSKGLYIGVDGELVDPGGDEPSSPTSPSPAGTFGACGNGVLDPAEECDDGNPDDGDGCNSSCSTEPTPTPALPTSSGSPSGAPPLTTATPPTYCGDAIIQDGEECDDGNVDDGDGCNSTCAVEPTPTPPLPSGSISPSGAPPLTTAAPPTYCGDAIIQDGEECDDGNVNDGDGCNSTCAAEPTPTPPLPSGSLSPSGAPPLTTATPPTYCGDAIIQDGEECDDGNVDDGDGCNSTCAAEPTPTPPLPSGSISPSGAPPLTTAPLPSYCGDALVQDPEQCDDGNLDDGDGCSALCNVEMP